MAKCVSERDLKSEFATTTIAQVRTCKNFLHSFQILFITVNGGWSDWTNWSECPVSCGGAVKERSRACNSPTPQYGGENCDGDLTETAECGMSPCPGMYTTQILLK